MNFDLLLGIWLGVCIAMVVGVKFVTWAILKAGEIVADWITRAM